MCTIKQDLCYNIKKAKGTFAPHFSIMKAEQEVSVSDLKTWKTIVSDRNAIKEVGQKWINRCITSWFTEF